MVKLIAKYLERFKYYPPYVGQKVTFETIRYAKFYNVEATVIRLWLNGTKRGDKAEVVFYDPEWNNMRTTYVVNVDTLKYKANRTTQILFSSKSNNR